MANVINKLTVGGISYNIASTAYATCATAATDSAKVAYIEGISTTSGFTLVTGTTVHVKFTYANTVSSPTLSINGSTAKSIKRYGTKSPSTIPETSWNAGEVVSFTYDGTYWQINKNPTELISLIARIETLETAIQDYINNSGGSGSNPSNPSNPDIGVDTVSCSTIAEIKALVSDTAFTFNGNCWIVYKSGNYTLLQDPTGYITVYSGMSSYSVSAQLGAFTGTAVSYHGVIEVRDISDITVNGTTSVSPMSIEHIYDFSLVPGYYSLSEKYFYLTTEDDGYDWWKCTDDECIWIRSDCSSHPASEYDAYTFELVIFTGYQGTPPPFKITPNGSNGVLLNFARSDGESPGGGGSEGAIYVNFSEQGFTNQQPVDGTYDHSGTYGDITSTIDQGGGRSTPKYYTSGGNAVRLYNGNTLTISGNGQVISAIEFIFTTAAYAPTNSGEFSCDSGTFDVSGSTYTWYGNAETVTFTVNKSQIRLQSYTVYF